MDSELVTVFGGTGFLGRAIVNRLVHANKHVRVATRHPGIEQADGVEQVRADIRDEASVEAAVAGARGVVNAVALYVEQGQETFDAVHVKGAVNLARQAKGQGLSTLVHISGIGAEITSSSRYVRARALGEQQVREVFPGATLLRPSVLFGPNDAFLSGLDQLTRFLPVVPLFGAGNTRLQPVYVEDVADAVVHALDQPRAAGMTYELGGAETYTYRGLLEQISRHRRHRRVLLPVPFALWEVLARLMAILPSPALTRDQIALMRQDNMVSRNAASFADLGMRPRPLSDLLPHCLAPPTDGAD